MGQGADPLLPVGPRTRLGCPVGELNQVDVDVAGVRLQLLGGREVMVEAGSVSVMGGQQQAAEVGCAANELEAPLRGEGRNGLQAGPSLLQASDGDGVQSHVEAGEGRGVVVAGALEPAQCFAVQGRGRGVVASYSRQIGRMTAGIGAGYDRRKFIGAPGTVLELADGLVDESYYVTAGLSGPVGQRGNFSVNSYANWFNSGSAGVGGAGVSLAILSASAAPPCCLCASSSLAAFTFSVASSPSTK